MINEMGGTMSSSRAMESAMEVDECNGLMLNDTFLPAEMLIQILFYVDPDTLIFSGRRVCKTWKRLIETMVLKSKVDRGNYRSVSNVERAVLKQLHLSWTIYYRICKFDMFGQNLLKNPSGMDELKHWDIIESGGDGWKVEHSPEGSEPLPKTDEGSPCFVTSFEPCTKQQIICLAEQHFNSEIMDEIQPIITVRDLYSARWDCGGVYQLRVALLDQNKKVICDFQKENESIERIKWHEIYHEFRNYGPGVRYIQYWHSGRDTQFWAGHYGTKMTCSTVSLMFPPPILPPVSVDDEGIEDLTFET